MSDVQEQCLLIMGGGSIVQGGVEVVAVEHGGWGGGVSRENREWLGGWGP